MEKTKAELYLEKVQKWKEQKMKDKEDRLKNKQKPSKQTAAVAVKPVGVKPAIKPVKSVAAAVPKTTIGKSSQHCTGSKQVKIGVSGVKSAPKVLSKPTGKVEKKRKSAETKELIERLNKWREEKKSEKKQIQKNVIPKATTKPTYKEVRSRLFDYQSKPKQHVSQKDKENVFISSGKTDTVPRANARKTEVSKAGVRRRHSDVQKVKPRSKPVGILKRKSCIGSFDLTGGDSDKSAAKRRRVSGALNTEQDETTKGNYVEKNNEPNNDNNNFLSGQVSTAAVTPGVSTRNVRFSTPPNDHSHVDGRRLRKTPKTPATRSAELSDWLKAKGRTPSKFRHLMCFHGEKAEEKSQDPHTKNTLSVEELSEQMDVLEQERLQAEAVDKMNSMLDECMLLFDAGCPTESIVPWLDDIYKQVPCSHTSARFYICKAKVIKSSLDLDAVLEIFAQATINNAQPKEGLAKCQTETLKYVIEEKVRQAKRRCYTPRRSEVQEENVFESSAVVYTVSNVTPFSEGKRSSSKKTSTPGQCQVITPVRRSTRRSLQNLPESLKDKKKSYSSLDDVKGDDVLFQPNLALDSALAAVEES
ncbi:cytoskeleton-associated protein 2-like [Mercenaria mercenaria]|uniref:cytoskeleton-associated protein 2-like n=1 Tax=Mercenaria mercenaria TaxID=6596 RepID=UPI00234F16E2|nr:cytoskeleton-associated protein 2-like [Mercenaria mercenaria]